MNEMRRGLPLTRARVEQIFPKLTQSQIDRFAALGHIRTIDRGEVLYEQGQSGAPLFVVVSGELEVIRPLLSVETLVTVFETRQFYVLVKLKQTSALAI